MKSTAVDGSRVFHYTGQILAKSIMTFAYRCAIMTIYSNQKGGDAMTELIQRVGYPMFIQMIIEFWNELILIMLTTIMLVGKSLDRRNELINKTKIPLTNELIFFYLAAFFYNMFDIISHYLSEYPKTHLMYVCAVFM